jgi:hypothetical protein
MLGRTSQAIINQVQTLHEEGFTNTEIGEKLKMDRKTVGKYLENRAGEGNGAEVEILFEAFFELLTDLSSVAVLDLENLDDLSNERALRVARKLFAVNKNLGKKVLGPYLEHLKNLHILDLKIPDSELWTEDVELRREWTELLKTNCPEIMTNLV